jgi:zinc protease
MNRTQAPEIVLIDKIDLPKAEKVLLDNGVPVYTINEGDQDVVKVELMFKAGKWFEKKNLVADLTNRMLREGTAKNNAKQIADAFDYYGANFNTSAGLKRAALRYTALPNTLTVCCRWCMKFLPSQFFRSANWIPL